MAYTLNVKKLVEDVRGQKGLAALKETLRDEADKIKSEMKRLEQTYKPQAKEQIKKLESRYHDLVKRVQRAQKDLDKELKTTLGSVKAAAQDAEKRLVAEKNRLQKDIVARFTKKKAAPRKKAASTGTATAAKKRKTKAKQS